MQEASRSGPPIRYLIVRTFRWHLLVFVGLNAALHIANALYPTSWWAMWPLLVSSFLIGVHYLAYKSFVVDEAWAEERTKELNLKSYDRSHIEDLKSRYDE